jgi:hypothetical protein
LSVAALLAWDVGRVREWVVEVLGDLAGDTDNDARLRETPRVFLAAGGSYKQAAVRLTIHFNTVKYRVERAGPDGAARSITTGSTSNWHCCCAIGMEARFSAPRRDGRLVAWRQPTGESSFHTDDAADTTDT